MPNAMCVNPKCGGKAFHRMMLTPSERRKVNYAGKERWVFLCGECYNMVVDILGYDPNFREEMSAGLPPA